MAKKRQFPDNLPDILITEIRLVHSPTGTPICCDGCSMQMRPSERCVDVKFNSARSYPEVARRLYCLACAISFLKDTDLVLERELDYLRERITVIKEIRETAIREVKRRGHIFIGRQLSGGA